MSIAERLYASVEALGDAGVNEVRMQEIMEPVWTAQVRLVVIRDRMKRQNSPEARFKLCVDSHMAAEEYSAAVKKAVAEFGKLAKPAAAQSDAVKAEIIPFAAEGAILGSTHAAEYVDGKDRVEVEDMEKAREAWGRVFWRFPDPEPKKREMREELERKGVREWGGVKLVQGEPSLRFPMLDLNKQDGEAGNE